MSSSSSKAKNSTTTTDQRTTNTLNAGLSGDIEDSFVAAGNYGDTSISSTVDSSTTENNVDMSRQFEDNSDNSFTLGFEDNSDSSTNYTDNSEYSSAFEVAFSDTSNNSQNYTDSSEYSSAFEFSDTSNNSQNYTDNSSYDGSGSINVGTGSYAYTSNVTDGGAFDLVGKMIDSFSETTNKIIDGAGNLTARSIDSAMSIKAGESLNERANSDLTAKLKTVGTVAAVGGVAYVAAKALGNR